MDGKTKAGIAIAIGAIVMTAVGGGVAWKHGVFERLSEQPSAGRPDTVADDQAEGGSDDQSAAESDGQMAGTSDDQTPDTVNGQTEAVTAPVAEWRVAPMTVFYRGGAEEVVRVDAPTPIAELPVAVPSPIGMEAPATDGPLVQAPSEGPKPMSKDDFFR